MTDDIIENLTYFLFLNLNLILSKALKYRQYIMNNYLKILDIKSSLSLSL